MAKKYNKTPNSGDPTIGPPILGIKIELADYYDQKIPMEEIEKILRDKSAHMLANLLAPHFDYQRCFVIEIGGDVAYYEMPNPWYWKKRAESAERLLEQIKKGLDGLKTLGA